LSILVTAVGVVDQYIILVSVTLLLTILSIAYRKSLTLSVLAVVFGLANALGIFAVGDQTSALTTPLAYLSLLVAVIFTVKTVLLAVEMLGERRRRRFEVVFE